MAKHRENSLPSSFQRILTGEAHREFQQALQECCNKLTSSERLSTSTFEDAVTLTAFEAGVQSPFSQFTGTHKNRMVIISSTPTSVNSPSQQDPCASPAFRVHSFQKVAVSHVSKHHHHFLHTHESLLPSSSAPSTKSTVVDLGAEPVTLETARYLVSLYSQAFFAGPHSSVPDIWILCQDKSTDIRSFGCTVEHNTNQKEKRLLRLFTIREGAPAQVTSARVKVTAVAPTQNGRHKKKVDFGSVHVYSEYELGPTMEEESLAHHAHILLQFVWSNEDTCFSPPPNNAEAVLSVSVKPGYQFSPILPICSEVQILNQLGSIAAGISSWPEAMEDACEDPTSPQKQSLLSTVPTFLEDASTQMLAAVENSVISPTAVLSVFQPREDLDFIGQLWMFARRVKNVEDLVDAFGLIFQAVLLGRIQPFIHHSKTSTLASLFRQVVSSTTRDQHQVLATKLQSLLTPERSLQCLVEIGIEKMSRDYFMHFTSNGLAASTQLEPFFLKASEGLLNQCQYLCRLHCALEIVAACTTFLNLPEQSLAQLTSRALEYYQTVDSFEGLQSTPSFLLPFTPSSVGLKSLAAYSSSLTPVVWNATTSGDKDKIMSVCTSDPLFKYMSPANSDNENTTMCVYHAACRVLQ